jgi:transcriptional regulator with XRE-family HTH domain
MSVATLSAENLIAAKLKNLGLSLTTFAVLAQVSAASLSRWLSGTQRMPNFQAESLQDLLSVIEDVYQKLNPIIPDLAHKDAVFWLRKLRRGRLIVPNVVDTDQQLRDRYAAGVGALSGTSPNESEQATGDTQ